MASKLVLEADDETIRFETNQIKIPFEGKVVLSKWDFRQCLLVVQYGNHQCDYKKSELWNHFQKLEL